MHEQKLKYLLKTLLIAIRIYCWFRQKKNKERLLAAFLLTPALFMLIPSYTFGLTLLQSFLFQAMLVYGLLSVIWIIKHHYRLAGINFIIYFLLLVKISGPINKTYRIDQGEETLKVLQFNVLSVNDKYTETIDRVIELAPDFVSFQEVSHQWAEVLVTGLAQDYPYYKVVEHEDQGQGIAVFSKYPLQDVEEIHVTATANITGKILVGDEAINFLALHTKSPTTRLKWHNRNNHLKWAEDYVKEQPGEFLVLGDFNTVPWDNRMLSFQSSTELTDSRKKLTPTYPTWNPFVAQIPIDYILHSKGIGCDSLDAVRITSDHKAIMGSFLVAGR
ncbi:endonuclease/exonuclease/phosphatase family protein [Roseivirga thermotolerans]|uniref:endonuclease/exonuclease/phosphatase family protein n=1 Tax=Roseivirga thermotolerans TaxID=1758176 RepID=UPI00273FEB06|nr:endonuclease/exonuclease/phosphatase family protein [Roseivirga thermotolerans]